ncbi:hypothetical protein NC651_006687 [Populus alba x Populus x berolinensis]|nr:hypothetical protein NC651_006687 [Populus alba x Populus x berolinensis]
MQILELEAPFRKWAGQPYPLGKFGAHFSNGHPRTRHYSLLLSKLKRKQQLHQRQPQYHSLRQYNFSTPKLCCCLFRSNSLHLTSRKGLTIAEEINNVSQENGDFESEKQTKPCELYVCNLSRCSDIADLVEMFKSFGSVLSVEEFHDQWKLQLRFDFLDYTFVLALTIHSSVSSSVTS